MSQINSNTKDNFQVVFQLLCFVGHPVSFFGTKLLNGATDLDSRRTGETKKAL